MVLSACLSRTTRVSFWTKDQTSYVWSPNQAQVSDRIGQFGHKLLLSQSDRGFGSVASVDSDPV